MARKSARKTRRAKSGKIVAQPAAFDHGTPEIQARREAALGASANLLPLSADNPVDILTARGFLSPEQNQAARDFQRVHAIVCGTSHAGAAALDAKRGGGLSVRARLVAQRQLDAWTRLVQHAGRKTINAFSRYVIDGYCDAAIVEIVRTTRTGGKNVSPSLTLEQLERIDLVRGALWAITNAPRVHVSDEEVFRAEQIERLGEVDGAEYAAATQQANAAVARMYLANRDSAIEFAIASAPRDRRAA